MEAKRPAYSPLVIDGLSYSDWEDDADRLRLLALGSGRVTRKHISHARRLLASLQDEIDSIDSVSSALSGFDAIRVGCVRDLLVAFRVSLAETARLLEARAPARTTRPRKTLAST